MAYRPHLVQRRTYRPDQLLELPNPPVHLYDAPRFRDVSTTLDSPTLDLVVIVLPFLVLPVAVAIPVFTLTNDDTDQPPSPLPPPPHLLQPPPHIDQPSDHLPRVDALPVLFACLQCRVRRVLELRFQRGEFGLEGA